MVKVRCYFNLSFFSLTGAALNNPKVRKMCLQFSTIGKLKVEPGGGTPLSQCFVEIWDMLLQGNIYFHRRVFAFCEWSFAVYSGCIFFKRGSQLL